MTVKLHLSLGPVQAFIAESRRTRDLWVGSYLLSYLAGRALYAAAQHGEIVLPRVHDDVLALYAPGRTDRARLPAHASLPNRFVLECADQAAAVQAAEAATSALRAAWAHIAGTVRKQFIDPVSGSDDETQRIWRRQVESFWHVVWVIGDDPALLDQRKHWRAPALAPDPEPGEHCTMMGRYQELSGFLRGQRGLEEFWIDVRARLGGAMNLDLRPDERLCAIALIKRLLPRVSGQALGRRLDEEQVAWPSTLYMAARPWIGTVCEAQPEPAARYAKQVLRARASARGERKAGQTLLDALTGTSASTASAGAFPLLDGNFSFIGALENERATPLDREDERRGLVKALKALHARQGTGPSPYYAFLLMDGDSLGTLLSRAEPRTITDCLSDFTERVPDIVCARGGATVYAGGDDVLALLPVEGALPTALALARCYEQRFADSQLDRELLPAATISGAIVFAHYHLPLRYITARAHELLDHVAKDQTGRASLAISLHQSSGETARFSVPWSYLRTDEDDRTTSIDPLLADIQAGRLGKSLLYRLRALLGRISGAGEVGPGVPLDLSTLHQAGAESGASDPVLDLFAAEIRSTRGDAERTPAQVRELAIHLQAACRVVRRVAGSKHQIERGHLCLDGARLAYFMATGGSNEDEI
ncbi:type III-B CRISPR-associated protein Cas10/Cmr2 [Haliangium ochraceum]|uniref:CRISPR-associated protein, Crm2 family n=1 Tax=Haliangium ochraceum (strain DSM 14365 / JCM 11303 / SMP-2) TaxID=502025 RepID=D0LTI0_HALO1|nr:type III-B CRISPR-associated protein Cas10/Cmr2 [Haliangium ochraceum]ACY13875.1 CRISPR-associated protein, Crm2 family [Haliangium ochraceum DSM 14365]